MQIFKGMCAMKGITPEEFAKRLADEFGYPETQIDIVAGNLQQLSTYFQGIFLDWWRTGRIPNIEIEGWTIERFQRERGYNPIAAFLDLDWLYREPKKALKSLNEYSFGYKPSEEMKKIAREYLLKNS